MVLSGDQLLTYADLAERWQVCERQAKRLVEQWGCTVMDLGHRTKRFRMCDVLAAEARMAGEKEERRVKKGKRKK